MLVHYEYEARFRSHGTITRVRAKFGFRPCLIRQTQYDSLYARSAQTINVFLDQFSRKLPSDVHAVLVLY